MKPLDLMLRDHITPVLTAAGYRRRGREYTRRAPHGDVAIVHLQTSAGSVGDQVDFYVNLGAVPASYADWLGELFGAPLARPGHEHGLWRDRLRPPPELADEPGPYGSDRWRLRGAAGVAACGAGLAAALTATALPLLADLLDRDRFLALHRDPGRPLGTGVVTFPEIFLLVDAGPSAALDAELAKLDAADPAEDPTAPRLAAWARARLAAPA
ncbi:MAG TPA: DUF4304 domain-containing protein [Pilimelia sp.]|nr:DUF4304 domain-containing protein [Pilimelia sp.]